MQDGRRFFRDWAERIWCGALAACQLAALTGCGLHAAADSTPKKDSKPEIPLLKAAVLTLEPQPWPAVVKTQGSLIADEVTVVGTKVAGRVADVAVDLGDVVAVGAPLARLEQEEFALEVTLAEAQLTQARAALGLLPADPVESLKPEMAPPVREARAVWDEIQTRIERLKALRVRDAVTKDELEQANASEGVAAARYAAAVNGVREKMAQISVRAAELSVAQQRLNDTLVRAPFAGLVQQRHVARGSYVQVGQPVVTLVRTSTLRFRGAMPERHAQRLALGQQVVLRIESIPQPQSATVTRISPELDILNRSLVFEATVDNASGTLRAGLFAEVQVVIDPAARALVVPQSAIVEFAGVEKVWKLVDGVAQEQPVETARRNAGVIEVIGGLAAGDSILVDAAHGRIAHIQPLPVDPSLSVQAQPDSSSASPDASAFPATRSAAE